MRTAKEIPEGAILDCGHEESSHSVNTRGYATDSNGKTLCYDCCRLADLAHMEATGTLCAYLSDDGKRITGWPGFTLLNVTREWVTRAGGFSRSTITRVWARDDNGNMWHGRGPGRGCYIRLRRSVDKRGRGKV